MNENELRLIEQRHIEAVLGITEPKKNGREPVEQIHREAIDQAWLKPGALPEEPRTIHYTELPEAEGDSPLYQEWNFYRREAGRLLAEGHEGRFLLIKGEDIIGLWDTHEEAKAVAVQKYLMQPCLIHQVRSREPLIRVSSRIRQWLS